MSDEANGSKPPRSGAQTAGTWDAEAARAAARKSAEVRAGKALSKLAPEKLADLAMEDLAFVRQKALKALKRGRLGARERCDLLKLTASIAETIMDRTRGRPRAEGSTTCTPVDYAAAVVEAQARAAQLESTLGAELPEALDEDTPPMRP